MDYRTLTVQVREDLYKQWISGDGGSSGGSGESGGSTIEYLDVSGDEYYELREVLCMASIYVKGGFGNTKFTGYPFSFFGGAVSPENVSALAIDFLSEISMLQNGAEQKATIAMLISETISQEQLDSIPRLTKEQFYDLNA